MAHLNHEQFDLVRKLLLELQPQHPEVDEAVEAMSKAAALVAEPGLREKAHDLYASDDVEIDDEGVGTSPAEGGTWVQAWVWVPDDD